MSVYNALHIAAKGGDLVQVQSQIGNFDINAKGKYEETALIKAAESGHADIVKLLLTLGADVNIPDVSTLFKMKSAQLICISTIPLALFNSLFPTHLDNYCNHSNPVTLSSYYLLQLINSTYSILNNIKLSPLCPISIPM